MFSCTISPNNAQIPSRAHGNPLDRSNLRTVLACGLLAQRRTCRTHSLNLQMQRIRLVVWLMAQLGARSNCRSRINTYSEKGNGANQTTPQSIEEGNWFKDESFAGVPMLSGRSPLSLTAALLTGNRDRDTFTFPSFLIRWAQSQILGYDFHWWLK